MQVKGVQQQQEQQLHIQDLQDDLAHQQTVQLCLRRNIQRLEERVQEQMAMNESITRTATPEVKALQEEVALLDQEKVCICLQHSRLHKRDCWRLWQACMLSNPLQTKRCGCCNAPCTLKLRRV